MSQSLREAATAYAVAGWQVLPCHPAGDRAKSPMLTHGFKDASTSPEAVAAWWEQWPTALIGLVVPPGAVVVDIDPRNLEEGSNPSTVLDDLTGPLPDTLTSWSGRGDGGRHLWFAAPALPEGRRWRNPAPGVDVKPPGRGYVIAPPSPHPATGQPYRWQDTATGYARLPLPALSALAPSDGQEGPQQPRRGPFALPWQPGTPAPPVGRGGTLEARRLAGMIRTLSTTRQGERNNTLNNYAYAVAREFDPANVEAALERLAQAAYTAGLTEPGVSNTIRSAKDGAKGRTKP